MSQHSDPARVTDPHALPDVEVFYVDVSPEEARGERNPDEQLEHGWYWWSCSPGCLPDGEPVGPFESEADAVADMEEVSGDARLPQG